MCKLEVYSGEKRVDYFERHPRHNFILTNTGIDNVVLHAEVSQRQQLADLSEECRGQESLVSKGQGEERGKAQS